MAPPLPVPIVKVGNRLVNIHPIFERLIRATYAIGMGAYARSKTWWNCREYRSTIDPFAVIYVDPAEITTVIFDPDSPMYACDIRGGDWDQTKPEPLSDYFGYRGFVQHFKEGIPWEDTDLYVEAYERIVEQDWELWGYRDMDAFRNHLNDVDTLYSEIDKNGYQTQHEIAADQGRIERIGGLPVGIDEIRVAIGRDGEISLIDGQHRLFCTKILGIEEIPVRVTLRHEIWQRKREAAQNLTVDQTHPDIQTVE